MKNTEIYKKVFFDGYKLRVKCSFIDKNDEHYNIDIYTTETNKDSVRKTIHNLITDNVKSFEIVHWATREQDDKSSELIDDMIKNW